LLGAVCLGGCRRKSTDFSLVNKVTIIATVYPIADVARQIGGDYVDVSWVVESGQSLTAVQPSSELRSRLSSTDIVISNGITEPWANAGFNDPLQQQHFIRLDLLQSPGESQEGFVWLDPMIVKNLAGELCTRLTVLRPEEEKYFTQRRDAYIAQIDALMQKYQPALAAAQTKQVLVLGVEFNALLSRFGLYPLMPVAESPLQLNDVDLFAIKRAANDKHTHLLLISTETPAVVATDLEQRASVTVVRLDCLGSSGGGGHNTYLDLMRDNLDQLLKATTVQ
jgi:zinc transport system substrate-binding protein